MFYATRFFANAQGISSLNVFTLAYLLLTLGELCLGPIGMSIITKLSPKKMFGMMMGLWFLSSAFGQLAAGKLGAEMSSIENASLTDKLMAYTEGYKALALYSLIAGLALILFSQLVKRLMQEVR
ncbi:Dipeptide and tripeptide permease B [compost metagenome]